MSALCHERKFNAYDHTEPLPPRNEDEDWADHRARLDAGRATIVEFCEAHGRRIHSDGFDYDPMHQGLVHKVDVHDDDGSRCTPVYAGLEWNAEFAAEVSYCSVSETGKRTDVTTTAYLTVQYMVALGETRFLWVLAVVAIAEPILLSATHLTITGFAGIVFAVQCVVAVSVLALGLRARRGRVVEAT